MVRSGRYTDAIKIGEEVIALYTELAAADEKKYQVRLTLVTQRFTLHMVQLGIHEDEVKAKEESIKLFREQIELDRKTNLPRLAIALIDLAVSMENLGRHEDAMNMADEIVEIVSELGCEDQFSISVELVESLGNLVSYMGRQEWYDYAAMMGECVVKMRRILAQRDR
ncbi:hypothetical protein FRC03_004173, partial [Tulasnella sp. 419]